MARFVVPEVKVIPTNFQFSAISLDPIKAASEYTLVTIVLDLSSSVDSYVKELEEICKKIIFSCKNSPRAENLMVRLVTFNYISEEVHGFKLLDQIDENEYCFNTRGLTALYDATFFAIGASITFSKELIEQDYECNSIVFIVTDGVDTKSSLEPEFIKKQIDEAKKQELSDSLTSILIGVNCENFSDHLEEFKKKAGLDTFVEIKEASSENLAKLANFIFQSISSQSQNLLTQ